MRTSSQFPRSPPPDDLTNDRRSRRDLSPLSRRVTECEPYSSHPPHPRDAMGRRSLSATTQFRSKSPPKRPFSPLRNEISGDFVTTHPPPPRVLRSATATPQGSPKKRQLPIVPPARERMSQVCNCRYVLINYTKHQSSHTSRPSSLVAHVHGIATNK